MTTPPLYGLSILVVEGKNSDASDLRSSLIRLGANVHVVPNVKTGLMVASRKRLHGAILDCVSHGPSLPLCNKLAANHVPFMFFGGSLGRTADDEAACMSELVATQARRATATPTRLLQSVGSGDDRHFVY